MFVSCDDMLNDHFFCLSTASLSPSLLEGLAFKLNSLRLLVFSVRSEELNVVLKNLVLALGSLVNIEGDARLG